MRLTFIFIGQSLSAFAPQHQSQYHPSPSPVKHVLASEADLFESLQYERLVVLMMTTVYENGAG